MCILAVNDEMSRWNYIGNVCFHLYHKVAVVIIYLGQSTFVRVILLSISFFFSVSGSKVIINMSVYKCHIQKNNSSYCNDIERLVNMH